MYFLSNTYRSVKLFFAGIGTIGSFLAIIYGAIQTGGTIYIIGGSITLANSLFNLWEMGKVNRDILKQVNNLQDKMSDFAEQNQIQKKNLNQLESCNQEFENKNEELRKTVSQTLIQLTEMEELRNKSQELQEHLEKNLELEKGNIVVLEGQNEELKDNLNQMYQIKEQLQEENQQYQNLIQSAQKQLKNIESLLDQVKEERDQLAENNEIQNQQIMKQIEIIQDSKALIVNLSKFGDKYQEFSDNIDTNIIKLDNTGDDLDQTANVMKNLVEKLKHQTFRMMDNNQDQQITKEEFEEALSKM